MTKTLELDSPVTATSSNLRYPQLVNNHGASSPTAMPASVSTRDAMGVNRFVSTHEIDPFDIFAGELRPFATTGSGAQNRLSNAQQAPATTADMADSLRKLRENVLYVSMTECFA